MLTNLKLIYVNNRDFARAVRVMDRSLEVAPEQWAELRDRGLVLLQNGEPGKALRDLKRYIELAPLSDDEQPVRQAIAAAQRLIAQLN
jgi:regulator of sirC expression with transglutaminase-like and TPR domain